MRIYVGIEVLLTPLVLPSVADMFFRGGSYPDTFSESDTGCQGRKKCQTRKSVRVGKGCQTWKFGREGLKSCQTRKFGCQGRKKVSDSENYAKMEKY